MPAYRITNKGKYSQIVAYTGSKIESRWAVGKQVYIDFEGPDFVVSSKDGVFLQIPIANIAEPQTQTNADLIQALAFMVSSSEGYEDDSIYVSDGTLTDNRALLGDGYNLAFGGIDVFSVNSRENHFTATESNILDARIGNVLNGLSSNLITSPNNSLEGANFLIGQTDISSSLAEENVRIISGPTTVDVQEDFVLVAEADATVDLPDGRQGSFFRFLANGNVVTINTQGSTTINGQTSISLSGQDSIALAYYQSNVYNIVSTKLEPVATYYNSLGLISSPIKIWTGLATSNASGVFTVDYSSASFSSVINIVATSFSTNANVQDRVWATMSQNVTLTQASGYTLRGVFFGLLGSGSSIRIAPNVLVNVIVWGT